MDILHMFILFYLIEICKSCMLDKGVFYMSFGFYILKINKLFSVKPKCILHLCLEF
ncbi:hypothetical protein ZOSMA_19G00870 [Zostera marina]|uniref:Uncharacterized protein n=1 Tax=Zostera marina TaxID=29655 RepID=A0A0K9PN50_ZOSMR|nr:hypothetical protein ZOSMA_19G00870 [Zostera marina]